MSNDNQTTNSEPAEIRADAQGVVMDIDTWTDSVTEFVAAADWLTPADRPQVKALYSIAGELDGGTFQAALISQFTLIHRALLARRPGGSGAGGSRALTDDEQILDMFKSNPGVWRA